MDGIDVLVVGAGPTGLVMAAELGALGVRVRLVDKATDRARESRALAIQPRSLEVLAGAGVADRLVDAGNRAMRLRLHAGGRVRSLPLFDLGLADSPYPFLLFLSQADTERILAERLTDLGVRVERGVELTELGTGGDAVSAGCTHPGGRREHVEARYVVGCDGAHSTVRRLAGIEFTGAAYPQTFVLADVEADGLDAGATHAFLADRGPMLFFPLGHPASWRLVAMRPPTDHTPPDAPVTLGQVQSLVDTFTGGAVRLRDPVWMTNFRLHHRAAVAYRAGPVFLAGDAAHIHSPAGAQGMNTGIQDAVNLGWKLAAVLGGGADPTLLDTYHDERAPVGRTVLRFTDRAFTAATSTGRLARLARTRIAPVLLPTVLASRALRAYAFRTVSQVGIRYRHSALSVEAPRAHRHGPHAGDRLPDAPLPGDPDTLHRLVAPPGWHLLRCGPPPPGDADDLAPRLAGRAAVHHLPDDGGHRLARRRLGVPAGTTGLYLVRPDGHVGYRCAGLDPAGLLDYLDRWLPQRPGRPNRPPAP